MRRGRVKREKKKGSKEEGKERERVNKTKG